MGASLVSRSASTSTRITGAAALVFGCLRPSPADDLVCCFLRSVLLVLALPPQGGKFYARLRKSFWIRLNRRVFRKTSEVFVQKQRPPSSRRTRRSAYSKKTIRASQRFLCARQKLSCVLPYTPLAKRSSWFDTHFLVLETTRSHRYRVLM